MMLSTFYHGSSVPESRSTKGASKQRRENINYEIDQLRNYLPLPESSRKRLSQLQIMVLSKTYIEMANAFTRLSSESFFHDEILEALPGFVILLSANGTILYISENATDYIGHSMVDIISQCESIYEHMHESDRIKFKALLSSVYQSSTNQMHYQPPGNQMTSYSQFVNQKKLSVTFRFGMMKHIRRNNNFDRYKVLRMTGRFMMTPNGSYVFAGVCTPQFESPHLQSFVDTEVFVISHNLDMTVVNMDNIAEHYLNESKYKITNTSMYEIIHPQDIPIFSAKHRELLKNQNSVSMKARLLQPNGGELNVQIMLVYTNDSPTGPLIFSYHQIIDPDFELVDKDCVADVGGLVKAKIEVEVECQFDRQYILRKIKNKVDKNNQAKRKALPSDPPPYTAAIAPKIVKSQNTQPSSDHMLIYDLTYNSPSGYESPLSVTSDYHAVASISEVEDIYQDDLSLHYPSENKMPILNQSDIDLFFNILNSKTEFIPMTEFQSNLSDLLSSDWGNINIENYPNLAIDYDNLIPAIY